VQTEEHLLYETIPTIGLPLQYPLPYLIEVMESSMYWMRIWVREQVLAHFM
jgi:hypothetical protein